VGWRREEGAFAHDKVPHPHLRSLLLLLLLLLLLVRIRLEKVISLTQDSFVSCRRDARGHGGSSLEPPLTPPTPLCVRGRAYYWILPSKWRATTGTI
jgi:hypothetical protein